MAALSDEATSDPITGLYNRRAFTLLADRNRDDATQCVIAIDIDHFKKNQRLVLP
nr:diguanylate cyclase [Pantoea rodasii]